MSARDVFFVQSPLHRNLQFGTGTYSIDASNSVIRSLTLRIFAYITGAVGILAIADFFILPGEKDADVIVTNPTHYAVALEYRPDKTAAPRVVAKGRN